MCPAADALSDIDLHCTDEELFTSLENIRRGASLPNNVITDVNPYQYLPSNLPGGVWFLIQSNEGSKDTKLACWKAKGVASKIFSNSTISCWKTTHEFYEGQAPHEHKTGWVIQEYRITKEGEGGNRTTVEAPSALCRVFHVPAREHVLDPGRGQSMPALVSENCLQDRISIVPDIMSAIGQGSTRNRQVEEDDRVEISAERESLLGENLPEIDHSWNDYIELRDLETPLSLSSSENSSCLTMSSDEYFDSLALLRELDPDNNGQEAQKAAGCKFSVATFLKPQKVVMPPVSLVRSNNVPCDEFLNAGSTPPGSAFESKCLAKEASTCVDRNRRGKSEVLSASNCHDAAPSSSRHKGGTEGGKRSAAGKMRKYLCFMPFLF